MAEQFNDEVVPFEFGPNLLPIVGMESYRSDYRTAPQFTHGTFRNDNGTPGRSATIPSHSEDAAADIGGSSVFQKRRTDNHLFVLFNVDGVQEFLEL